MKPKYLDNQVKTIDQYVCTSSLPMCIYEYSQSMTHKPPRIIAIMDCQKMAKPSQANCPYANAYPLVGTFGVRGFDAKKDLSHNGQRNSKKQLI